MGSDSVKSNDFSSGSDLQNLARQWFPLMSKRDLSEEDLQTARRLQGQFSTLPDADRERLKDMIRQMQTDKKPMFLGGPRESPKNAMTPAEEASARVSDKFGSSIGDVLDRVGQGARMLGNAMLGTYGKIRDAESDPRMPSDMRKDEIAERMSIAPDVMVPASAGRLAMGSGVGAELGALAGKSQWSPEMVRNLLRLDKETPAGKGRLPKILENWRELHPEYEGGDSTIKGQLSKARAYGGLNADTGAPRAVEASAGDLTRSKWPPQMEENLKSIVDDVGSDYGSRKVIAQRFMDMHPDYMGGDQAIYDKINQLSAGRGGETELGALGGKGRNSWTPEMVATLRDLKAKYGNDRGAIIADFRDIHPGYTGSDGTLTVQMSKVERNGAVNAGLDTGPQSGKLTREQGATMAELANTEGMNLADKIDAFREAHPDYTGSRGTIVRRLKDAEGGDFELGAMGGRGPGGRITQQDIEDLAAKIGTSVRSVRTDPKNGTVYATVPSAENPGNQIWDTVVRIPTDNKSHPGRRIPGSNQYVIDTTDAAKNYDPRISTNMGGGRYNEIDNVEAALRARNGESIPDELRPTPQQLPLRGSKVFPREKVAPRQGEPAPPEPPPDPNQLKLLASGAPIGPFETTVEQEPGTSTFAKSPDIRQSQDELLASSTRHLADKAQALNNEADDLTSYPRLRFGLPPGFILDTPNAMKP